jgi:subtilisin family serine protease
MRRKGSLMTRMARISLVVCVLVSVIFIEQKAFAQSAQNLRRIVTFQGIDLTTPLGYSTALGVVTASGSSLVHNLSFINALAIQLPANNIIGALNILLSSLCGPITQQIKCVQDIADDTVAIVDGGSRCVRIVPASGIVPAPGNDVPGPEKYPWGMQIIDVPAVHPQRQGLGVTVAVLDTGIASHPELSGQIERYNARYGDSSDADDNGHGTHMAGIIAAARNNPVLGIIGVAPQVTLKAVKVLDQYGAGYLSDVINGLQWVHNNRSPRAKVVNMSIGWSADIPHLRKAIHELDNQGVIMVASAGNLCPPSGGQDEGNGDECEGGPHLACAQTDVKYPAAYDEVIAVEATDFLDQIAPYSLSGDVAAPGGSKATGVRILSTHTGGRYGYGSGTSPAAAHVTGAVALALQLDPGLSLKQVRCVLQATAEGPGRINVDNMVHALLVGHPCL